MPGISNNHLRMLIYQRDDRSYATEKMTSQARESVRLVFMDSVCRNSRMKTTIVFWFSNKLPKRTDLPFSSHTGTAAAVSNVFVSMVWDEEVMTSESKMLDVVAEVQASSSYIS
jgi:hypothetical protein